MRNTIFLLATLFALIGLAGRATHAEPPSVSYIFPAGAQRGTSVQARVGGHYMYERARFQLSGPGVTAPTEIARTETIWFEGPLVRLPASQRSEDYPKDYLAPLTIAADAPTGPRTWQVWNSQGATPARKFIVGDLPEVVEHEIDGDPIPTSVTMPVTINGRTFPREDVDIWTVNAVAGRTVTCSVAAQTIGSPLEARLEVRDPAGRPIAEAVGGSTFDPLVQFTPAVDGVYQIRIHDVRFEGLQHFVYRLTVTDGPWVRRAIPLGARAGAETRFTLTGANVPETPVSLALPADAHGFVEARFNIGGRATNPVLIAVDELTETLEAEPNDSIEQGTMVALPAAVGGVIERPGDIDGYWFVAEAGAEWTFTTQAAQLGSSLDALLIVRDSDGKEFAKADDGPAGSPDALLKFKAPKAGRYRLEVSDRFTSRGGPGLTYRVAIAQPKPSVRLELAVDSLNLDRGGQQKLAVNVLRDGGMNGPVTLSVEGLPPGVQAAELVVAPNQNKGELQLKAEPTAKVGGVNVRVTGKAEIAGAMQSIVATTVRRGAEATLDRVLLAVTIPTPFKFQGAYEMTYIPCGGVSRKKFTIERNGYDGPLEVQLADRQNRHLQGVTGPTIVVPAGATEFVYPITLPPWMELGRTSRTVLMAVGEVDDGQGGRHKVSFSSADQNNQMVNLVSPSPLRLLLDRPSLAVSPGGRAELIVQVRRDRTLQAPVRLELVAPKHLRDVTAAPIDVPADQETARLTLNFGANPGPLNAPIVIRGIARRRDEPLTAEAPIELVLVDAK
ncbi:MAG TPA: PPC domain-containing protein [Pirellulaceae bacterium]|nr:PPC domain-containing protein [Pirellulaceae bacterium]